MGGIVELTSDGMVMAAVRLTLNFNDWRGHLDTLEFYRFITVADLGTFPRSDKFAGDVGYRSSRVVELTLDSTELTPVQGQPNYKRGSAQLYP